MRNTIVATAVVVLLMTELVGCKSTPKMPWSRTAATSDIEAAAVAHSAPALPADIAKQAEALAASTPSINLTSPQTTPQMSASQAPAYSLAPAYSPAAAALAAAAPATPSAYPSTGASSYSASASPYSAAPAQNIAATPPSVPPAYQSTDQSADLGAFDKPYDPNAVPPAKTAVAATTTPMTPKASTDRYGMNTMASTVPANGGSTIPSVEKTPASTSGRYESGNRYGNVEAVVTTPTPKTTPKITLPAPVEAVVSTALASTNSAAPSTTKATPTTTPAAIVDRYAAGNTFMPTTPSEPKTSPATVTPTQVVASASVYRPGGTTSYAGTLGQAVTEIATRTKPAEQAPGVSTPTTTAEPSQAPRYR